MAEIRIKYTLINRILNINSSEWPRIMSCFLLRFFHRFGFVVGWTVIVALVVTNFGINYLPYFFIANGLFIILSGTLYSTLVRKMKNSTLIVWTVFVASIMIFLSILLINKSNPLFFFLIIAAESFFLYQLNVLISAFVERFFDPLSSLRVFPFIESAETLAILLAGLMFVSFASVLDSSKFFYIWILAILLLIPVIFYTNHKYEGKYPEENPAHIECDKKNGFFGVLINGISRAQKCKFLWVLIFIIMFQWVFVSLMEFQYTKAISASVLGDFAVPQSTSSYEHALVHALGSLQILFGSSALLIQLFIGAKIITSLGIISSMLLYPIVAFLSIFGLSINFSYLTGVLAKNNTEMTNVIFKNAYHSSFYLFSDKSRELSREFLEGFVRPFAAVIAMSVIILLQFLFKDELLKISTNIFLALIAVLLFGFVLSARKKYTESAASILFNESLSVNDKLNAINILAQKGHKSVSAIFSKALKTESIPTEVKVKVLGIMASFEEKEHLPLFLDVLDLGEEELTLASLHALLKYSNEKTSGIFTEYRFFDTLISLFDKSSNFEIRKAILENIANFDTNDSAGFLVKVLEYGESDLKAVTLLVMKNYEDISIAHYIKPFLSSPDPNLMALACVPLWQFNKYKSRILNLLSEMMNGSSDEIMCAIYSIAQIGLPEYRKKFNQLMKSEDLLVSLYASYGLAKLGYLDSVPHLAHLLLLDDELVSQKLQNLLIDVPSKVLKHVKIALRQVKSETSLEITKILELNIK